MPGYGHITRSSTAPYSSSLAPTLWPLPDASTSSSRAASHGTGPMGPTGRRGQSFIAVHTLPRPYNSHPELTAYLYEEYAAELARGQTFPQEPSNPNPSSSSSSGSHAVGGPMEDFQSYFFESDVFIGIEVTCSSNLDREHLMSWVKGAVEVDGYRGYELHAGYDLETARAGRDWSECVAGFYYMKPNYPGRSSHICNGGIIIPFPKRNLGAGRALGLSYIHYAPLLGYRASIFNLVYANNTASIRIWRTLGFTEAWRIPQAGRMKRVRSDGTEFEEYVDAIVFYKNFYPEEVAATVARPSDSVRIVDHREQDDESLPGRVFTTLEIAQLGMACRPLMVKSKL